jgi:hypothetical protein
MRRRMSITMVEGVEGVELASRQPEVGKKAGGLKRVH